MTVVALSVTHGPEFRVQISLGARVYATVFCAALSGGGPDIKNVTIIWLANHIFLTHSILTSMLPTVRSRQGRELLPSTPRPYRL
jgi:hypothetical protein